MLCSRPQLGTSLLSDLEGFGRGPLYTEVTASTIQACRNKTDKTVGHQALKPCLAS